LSEKFTHYKVEVVRPRGRPNMTWRETADKSDKSVFHFQQGMRNAMVHKKCRQLINVYRVILMTVHN